MHLSTENIEKTLEITKGGIIQKGDQKDQNNPCCIYNIANSIRKVSRDQQIRHSRVFELVYIDIEKITPIGLNRHI
jgi:hypothetical protein